MCSWCVRSSPLKPKVIFHEVLWFIKISARVSLILRVQASRVPTVGQGRLGKDKPMTDIKEVTTFSCMCEWCPAGECSTGFIHQAETKCGCMINCILTVDLRLIDNWNDFLSQIDILWSDFMKVLVRYSRQSVTKYLCTNWQLSNILTLINLPLGLAWLGCISGLCLHSFALSNFLLNSKNTKRSENTHTWDKSFWK